MADFLTLLAAFVLVAAFLALGLFILKLGVLERRAMRGEQPRSPLEIPELARAGVQNPFVVRLGDAPWQDGFISVIFSSTVSCYTTFYWGVTMATIEKSLCTEEPRTNSDDDDDDDSGENEVHFVPVHRILAGSYESKGSTEYYESGQDFEIKEQIPVELVENQEQECFDNSLYQLVVVNERTKNTDHHENTDPCEIVSLLTAFKCSSSSSGSKRLSLAAQYIQIANGRLFPLKKLYVSTDETESPSNNQEPISTCVVCHSMPVTRVLLPCRHACVCGICFSKLELKCPMCRQWIRSYFLTQEEPELASNELDTSRELHAMSLGDIVRGIWNSG